MAFFGMDSSQVQHEPGYIPNEQTECLLCEAQQNMRVHCLFHQFRAGDVVFLKKFTPQAGMEVLAVGVVAPGSLVKDVAKTCVHVQWAWHGVQHAVVAEDHDDSRSSPIYEEFDLAIQREIMSLMPSHSHDPFAMVMAAPSGLCA